GGHAVLRERAGERHVRRARRDRSGGRGGAHRRPGPLRLRAALGPRHADRRAGHGAVGRAAAAGGARAGHLVAARGADPRRPAVRARRGDRGAGDRGPARDPGRGDRAGRRAPAVHGRPRRPGRAARRRGDRRRRRAPRADGQPARLREPHVDGGGDLVSTDTGTAPSGSGHTGPDGAARGDPGMHGASSQRGAPSQHEAPSQHGAPSKHGAPGKRGAFGKRGGSGRRAGGEGARDGRDPRSWRGVAAETADELSAPIEALLRKRSRRLLGDLLRPHRKIVALTAAAVIISSLTSLAGPWLIGSAIDNGIPPLVKSGDPVPLLRIAVVFAGTVLVQAAATRTFVTLTGRFGQAVVLELRRRLFAHVLRLPVSFHESYTSGRVISRQTSDVE